MSETDVYPLGMSAMKHILLLGTSDGFANRMAARHVGRVGGCVKKRREKMGRREFEGSFRREERNEASNMSDG